MIRVVITSDIAQNSFGLIFGCRDEAGTQLRVIFPVDTWPALDSVWEVEGEIGEFCDKYRRKYPQITATTVNRVRTSGRLIRPWLERIPGIGEARSGRLLEAFGDNILDCLRDPHQFDRIAAALDPAGSVLGEKLAAQVQAHCVAHKAEEDVAIAEADFLLELEKCGVDNRQAAKQMFRLIGSRDAFDKLMEQPYLAAGLLPWKQADHLGLRLLARRGETNPKHSPERLAGACDSVWRDLLKKGHTAASLSFFQGALKNKRVPAQKALKVGIQQRRMIEAEDLLRAPGAAYLEATLAQRFVSLMNGNSGIDVPGDVEGLVRSSENPKRPLTSEQREAVCGILRNKFAILQGGAGTGKTTTMKVLVESWQKMGGNVILGALSGKAALRLSRSTGKLSETLARHLIKFEKSKTETETKGLSMFPDLTGKTLFIIDESSMVDLATMNKLMGHIPEEAHLLLVGDIAQLPPVGLGQIYHDLVAADINVFRLTQVLRQKDENGKDVKRNPIIDVAADIREGKIPTLPIFKDIDTGAFHLNTDETDVDLAVVDVLKYLKGKASLDEILVLASLRRTCKNINNAMATRKQVDGVEGIRLSTKAPWVSLDDPIICVRNRYEDGLMNGQIGHINTLDPLTVRWDGEPMGKPVDATTWIDLASAWGITCHRAQGSEARFVVVALDGEFMLSREWLYTAATRATQQVIFVGPMSLIEKAVEKRATRTTYFAHEIARRRGTYEHSGQNRQRSRVQNA